MVFHCFFAGAMTMESTKHFFDLAKHYKLGNDTIAALKARNWETMHAFAFCCSAKPGGDANAFKAEVLDKVGVAIDDNDATGMRRLYFECWNSLGIQTKRRIAGETEDSKRKLPRVEVIDRKEQLQKVLGKGVTITGALEPSQDLIDLAQKFNDEDEVFHIPLHKCTSKSAAMKGIKSEPTLVFDSKTKMPKLVDKGVDIEADVKELLDVQDTLKR